MSSTPSSSSGISHPSTATVQGVPAGTPTPVEQSAPPTPGVEEMLQLFRAQNRQCWICERIAGRLEKGENLSEEDTWHFTTCVMSWHKLNPA